FALVREPDGTIHALNASGAAPREIDVESLRHLRAMPPYGPLPITVPGAVSGWEALAESGSRLGFRRAFGAAIHLARSGVPVAASVAATLSGGARRLSTDSGMRQVFFPTGPPLAIGDSLVQSALAETL